MRVFVTGGTGFTGRRVVADLVRAGHEVTCLVRPGSDRTALAGVRVGFAGGDLADPDGLVRAVDGHDGLLHVASLGFGHGPGIVSAAIRAGVSRGVFFSSTAVFTRLPAATRAERLSAESSIRDSGLDWTILRPTMIYGAPGDRNVERLLAYLERWRILPVPGGGGSKIQPIVVDDLAGAAVRALGTPAASRRCYSLAGAAAVTFSSFVCSAGRALGRRPILLPVPAGLATTAGRMLEGALPRPFVRAEQIERLLEDKDFDTTAAGRDLGFQPMGVEDGLALEVRRRRGAA